MSAIQQPPAPAATEALIQQVIGEAICELPQRARDFPSEARFSSALARLEVTGSLRYVIKKRSTRNIRNEGNEMSETQDIDNLKLLGLNTVNNIYMQVMVVANHRRLQSTCVSWILKRRNGWTCMF